MTFAKLSNKSSAKQSHLVQYKNCFPVFPHGPSGCFIRIQNQSKVSQNSQNGKTHLDAMFFSKEELFIPFGHLDILLWSKIVKKGHQTSQNSKIIRFFKERF